MRPLIGIPCHSGESTETNRPKRPIYYNNRSYIHAVERAGGVPVLIPILDDLVGLEALLPRLDGLLLSGGIDVDPRHYQEEPHPLLGDTNPKLDELEITLARWALHEDIPTLGICRGTQVINVALGGSLYQDLNDQYPGSLRHPNWDLPRNKIIHSVQLEANSRIAKVLGTREVPVNSLHHQAVKQEPECIKITGRAEDGVVELIEVPEHRFMLGAQCHPEELYNEYPMWRQLFEAFIHACTTPSIRPLDRVEQPITTKAIAV